MKCGWYLFKAWSYNLWRISSPIKWRTIHQALINIFKRENSTRKLKTSDKLKFSLKNQPILSSSSPKTVPNIPSRESFCLGDRKHHNWAVLCYERVPPKHYLQSNLYPYAAKLFEFVGNLNFMFQSAASGTSLCCV